MYGIAADGQSGAGVGDVLATKAARLLLFAKRRQVALGEVLSPTQGLPFETHLGEDVRRREALDFEVIVATCGKVLSQFVEVLLEEISKALGHTAGHLGVCPGASTGRCIRSFMGNLQLSTFERASRRDLRHGRLRR